MPQGWAIATLSQLIAPSGIFADGDWIESKDQDPDGAIRLLQLADIGDGVFVGKSNRFINKETFDRLRCTQVIPGDVLIARMPDPLGRACLAPRSEQKRITVVDVAIIRPGPDSVMPHWLMHVINSPTVREVIELESSGTTRRRIARGKLAVLSLPIPPLGEQRRIAEKVGSMLEQINSCRERLHRVPPILKRFRDAVLEAAVAGRLTEDWRGEPELTGWVTKCASEACTVVQSGGTPKAGFTESAGVPFLKVYNIVDQQISFDYRPQYVPRTTHEKELRKSRTLPGDVLMNIVGPPLGKVAVVTDTYPEWNINQAITLFRPGPEVSTQWIYTVLCSGKNVADVIHQTRGSVGQVNISLSQCRNFEIPIPPPEEQAEIVRRLGELFVLADSLQRRYQDSVARVEKLTPSVLTKAFHGGLVPQDPNDEPAAAMLERVRAAGFAYQTPKTKSGAAGRRRR